MQQHGRTKKLSLYRAGRTCSNLPTSGIILKVRLSTDRCYLGISEGGVALESVGNISKTACAGMPYVPR